MSTPCALVTGASRGIGAAIAGCLAAEGYALTVSARGQGDLDGLAARLRAEHGTEALAVAADVTADADLDRLVSAHTDRFGRLDLLVLNAGMGVFGPFADVPTHRQDRQLSVNLRAPMLLTRRCLPLLRKAARGAPERGARIVALASITGVAAEAGLAMYGATKAALISLCESVTLEESAAGVSATAVSPGYVDTDMTAWLHDDVPPEEMIPVSDVVEVVRAVTRLSATTVVPNIVLSRRGDRLWRA